ncbi:MAG: hypothetical protein HC783_15160 [Rhodobacteraceae bacterium]|nr:hypothetical protein [Paracoccaceae bacterium]
MAVMASARCKHGFPLESGFVGKLPGAVARERVETESEQIAINTHITEERVIVMV